MTGKELRVPDYVGHIIEAIDRIGLYVSDTDRDAFGTSNLASTRDSQHQIAGTQKRRQSTSS
jgi:uncharacterized protein with HEPN domain